ncbi:MAG: T9SS type A sorting domain-containing protein [Hymenobacter sp.]|nr:MAG: T9SS type A sorting domain-containing protein [Hymenobacter sp.]
MTGSLNQTFGTNQTRAVATDASGNVFVVGNFTGQVYFGSTLLTSQGDNDIFVAKYVPGTNTWAWAQSGGGIDGEAGQGIAVSSNSVYVTGSVANNAANANNALLGNTDAAPGTVVVRGATATVTSDLLVAKFLDQGSSASVVWTQVGGGTGNDGGYGLAVQGSSVYVTGSIFNNTANANSVVFGSSGTTAGTAVVNGASPTASSDVVVAKYTDNGTSGTFAWSQVGSSTSNDGGNSVAVSGTSIYVSGVITNTTTNANGVLLGGSGPTASLDVLVAKYLDNGASSTLSWAQVGGGPGDDNAGKLLLSGQRVLVAGYATPPATFGSTVITGTANNSTSLAESNLTPLPVRPATASSASSLHLYPNPTTGTATLNGLAAGQAVQVLDALGRVLASATADADGYATLRLPAGLPGGMYVVRAGQQALRLAVE